MLNTNDKLTYEGGKMSSYFATINWVRDPNDKYIDNKYSRGHEWDFDGGLKVQASSSPNIVPLPYSIAENIDPEEAFVASLSSCHMLFFLSIAAQHNFVVDSYCDNAVGIMAKDSDNKVSMTKVTLRPKVKFLGPIQPSLLQLEKMHHKSHEQCFIANSVKTKVVTEVAVYK